MRRTKMQNTTRKARKGLSKFNVKHVIGQLNHTADLLELTGERPERVESFRNAHQQLRTFDFGTGTPQLADFADSLMTFSDEVRSTLVTFACEQPAKLLEELKAAIPASVIEMLAIPGLGPKRLREVWACMNITSMAQLYHATTENRLLKAKGFGPKTQAKVRQGIINQRKSGAEYFYNDLIGYAKQLHAQLESNLGNGAAFHLSGDVRAARAICNGINFVVHADFFNEVMVMLIRQPEYELMTAAQNLLLARVRDTEIPIEFRFGSQNYYLELFRNTGSNAHVKFVPVDEQHEYASEHEIYADSGLKYLHPELREGREELMPAMNRKIEHALVQEHQIKGLIHAHTNMSDGSDSLEKMALACRDLGMEYLGITDHAPNAWHNQGISEANLEAQRKQINKLNKQLAPFKVFWGIEADIQEDGGLGMSDQTLSQFDFVIAALHSDEKLSPAEATMRTIKAIQNPHTTILAHPNGQLLGSDESHPIELDLIMEACLENQVVIELNCTPTRMDLNWEEVRAASKMGLTVAVNPDAHSVEALSDYIHGVKIARKGLLPNTQCLNALSREEFEVWLQQRNSNRI